MKNYQPNAEELKLVKFFTKQTGEQFRIYEGSFQLSNNFDQGWTGYEGSEAGLHEMLQQLSWESEHRVKKK